jgi:tetratricopeptide (TPR) repeat protein
VSRIALRCLPLVALAAALSAPASAQQAVSISGEVIQEGGPLTTGLAAELYDPVRGTVIGSSPIRLDGTFELSNLPVGEFLLRVKGPYGDSIQQTPVSLHPGADTVEIRLPAPARPPTGTISIARLEHKVPPKALRELRRENEALRRADLQGSIAHLRQALKIDPDFMEAHNNLGTRYMMTGEFDEAAAEFQKAVTLDPDAPDALLNWAGSLYALRHYGQAEDAARRALARKPGSLRAKYVLGLVLLVERKSGLECLRALESAAAKYPKAGRLAEELRQQFSARPSPRP